MANSSALGEWVDNETCFSVDFPVNLNKLARLINSLLDNNVDRKIVKKWVGNKILDWNEVVERLEDIYGLNVS